MWKAYHTSKCTTHWIYPFYSWWTAGSFSAWGLVFNVALTFLCKSLYSPVHSFLLGTHLGKLSQYSQERTAERLTYLGPAEHVAEVGSLFPLFLFFLVTQLAGHRGLMWEGMGYPFWALGYQLSELWRPVGYGCPTHPGQPFQHAWCFQEVPSISHSCSCKNWIF